MLACVHGSSPSPLSLCFSTLIASHSIPAVCLSFPFLLWPLSLTSGSRTASCSPVRFASGHWRQWYCHRMAERNGVHARRKRDGERGVARAVRRAVHRRVVAGSIIAGRIVARGIIPDKHRLNNSQTSNTSQPPRDHHRLERKHNRLGDRFYSSGRHKQISKTLILSCIIISSKKPPEEKLHGTWMRPAIPVLTASRFRRRSVPYPIVPTCATGNWSGTATKSCV